MPHLADDGSVSIETLMPEGWVQQGDRYVPTWPACRYRCLSYGDNKGVPWVAIHCRLRHLTGDIKTCLACEQAEADDSEEQTIPRVDESGKQTGTLTIKVSKHPDRAVPADASGKPLGGVVWTPDRPVIPATPNQPRPDLAAIALTLPPPDPVQDKERTFPRPVFEPDGTIVYPKGDGDWEPPQDINGYTRDPNNPWRFLPLWQPCVFRLQAAFLKATCGCIDIKMRCNNPAAPTFSTLVAYTTCNHCSFRRAT